MEPNDDYDSPWKDLLEVAFEPFMRFFFPQAAAEIDWSRGYESLDQAFQQVVREAETGRRYADKLMKVWRVDDGQEIWVLVHVEIQASREAGFAERLYVYNYRIFDRYHRPVATFAILADDDAAWRPGAYERELFGCKARLDFPRVKLLDYQNDLAALARDPNPFAVVVHAHLATKATRHDLQARLSEKLRITRRLYELGYGKDEILMLYAFIDWVMALPEELAIVYHETIRDWEAETMRYVTTAERIGMKQGLEQGKQLGETEMLLRLLEKRFGPLSEELRGKLQATDAATLLEWSERLWTAERPEDVIH